MSHCHERFLPLPLLFLDEHLVAIDKPAGLLVHRSRHAGPEDCLAMLLLRDQLGRWVYPIHRLDRKTSGVMLFALSPEGAALAQQKLAASRKTYWAITRGYFPERLVLDHPLADERGLPQEATTEFERLLTTELPLPMGQHASSRYSLVRATPRTGRGHQIRRHCSHLRHPVIGDRGHGCNKQNRLFKEKWGLTDHLLHALSLEIEHPITGEPLRLLAPPSPEFRRMQSVLGLELEP